MASEKKPSIYDDRGSIGSTEELDEYGVWVKSEPQEMSGSEDVPDLGEAFPSGPASAAELPDLELLAMDELAEAVELSSKPSYSGNETESFTIGDYDESDGFSVDEDMAGGTDEDSDTEMFDMDLSGSLDSDDTSLADTGLADTSGEEDEAEEVLMDFDFSDLSDPEAGLLELSADPDEDETDAEAGYDLRSSLLDEEPDEKAFKAKNEIEELGFTEVSMDTFSDVPAEEVVLDDEILAGETLDELDLDDSALDENFSTLAPEDTFEDTDGLVESLITEDIDTADSRTPTKETDLSTQLLMKIAEELSSIRTELSTLKKEMSVVRPETPQEGASQGFFNESEDDEKISVTGDEMDDILNTEGSADEEIMELSESGIEISESDIDLMQEENLDEAQPHGFFDESEDDETIALTGDELNNILNTADFTEETGADAGGDNARDAGNGEEAFEKSTAMAGSEDDDLVIVEEPQLVDLDGAIVLDGESPAPEDDTDELMELVPEENPERDDTDAMVLEELSADELAVGELSIDEALVFPDDDDEEISQLREEGVEPMTAAPEPEESGFLESDPLALTGLDEESLDFSGAVIDEPDLSSAVQDNPVIEPSLEDISIELEFDEDSLGVAAAEIAEDEELNLDVTEEIEVPLEDEEDIPLSPEGDNELPYAVDDVPEDDDLALLPEGFVVEADDTQTGVSDEEIVYSGGGEESFPGEEPETTAAEKTPPEVMDAESAEASQTGNDNTISQDIPPPIKNELKTVLSYMDQLLESLPDEKIEEFARSEYFDTYKKLFKELGLV